MDFNQPIRYKQFKGHLDPLTGKVKFYNCIYSSIKEAIKSELILSKHKMKRISPYICSFRTFRTN